MQLTTTLVAALGLLSSVTVALPTSDEGPTSESNGLKARSVGPLGVQGSIANGLVPPSGFAPPNDASEDPRLDPNYHDDKQRRSPLGIQGSIMSDLAGAHKDLGKELNDGEDDKRRSVDTTTEAASTDAELFSFTLCDKIDHGGICVVLPMEKNKCQSFPLLVNTRSIYMLSTTQW